MLNLMFFDNTFCFIGLLFKIVCGSFACFICHLEIFPNKNYIKVIFKIILKIIFKNDYVLLLK